jgi:hypothetical protein
MPLTLGLAATAATAFSRLSTAQQRITLVAAVAVIGLPLVVLRLSAAWAAAVLAMPRTGQQTLAAVAVGSEVKLQVQVLAALALSLSVTHSVWHKDFK